MMSTQADVAAVQTQTSSSTFSIALRVIFSNYMAESNYVAVYIV